MIAKSFRKNHFTAFIRKIIILVMSMLNKA